MKKIDYNLAYKTLVEKHNNIVEFSQISKNEFKNNEIVNLIKKLLELKLPPVNKKAMAKRVLVFVL